MFIWGASWVAIKILSSMAPPLTIGFFRYSVASVLFIALLLSRKVSLRTLFRAGTTRFLVLGGLTGIFGFMFLSLIGTRFTTAGQASIIAGTNPITITFFVYILHKEKLESVWRYLGIAFSFIGIVFVVGIQALLNFNFDYLVGNFILILAMIGWGIYSAVGKSAMETMSPAEATAGCIFVGWAIFAVGAATEIGHTLPLVLNVQFWWNVTFLGVFSSFFGFLMYFEAIKRIGATKTSGFTSLVPVFGTLTSIIILQEIIYWTFIVGLALVVIGILVLNMPDRNGPAEGIVAAPA
jgi:drug/metabolite transporter (DMT)-like permease